MTQKYGDSDEEGGGETVSEPDAKPKMWWDDPTVRRERMDRQIDAILDAIDGASVFPEDRTLDMQYLYVAGRILVRDVDLARVRAVVPGDVVESLVNGVTAYRPANTTTTRALEAIEAALGIGVASPDHIFYITPASSCPATEPVPAGPYLPDPPPRRAGSGDGRGSLVSVVDTGFIEDLLNVRHFWLDGVTGDFPREFVNPNNIGLYVGHGTFVAGIVRCVAPDADVHVHAFLPLGGAITEANLLLKLDSAIEQMPDVISMSAGCTTRHNLPPLGFEALWEHRLRHCKGTVLVVAAGNNASREPFWPAAFPWTVSVGALNRDGSRAPFSDFGSWVDVYATGVDVINAFPNGTYNYKEPPKIGQQAQFDFEMAAWSGTSFATPLVAGMIAARRSRTGQSGRQAADSILRIARTNATPGVGAIADPSMTFDPDPGGW